EAGTAAADRAGPRGEEGAAKHQALDGDVEYAGAAGDENGERCEQQRDRVGAGRGDEGRHARCRLSRRDPASRPRAASDVTQGGRLGVTSGVTKDAAAPRLIAGAVWIAIGGRGISRARAGR